MAPLRLMIQQRRDKMLELITKLKPLPRAAVKMINYAEQFNKVNSAVQFTNKYCSVNYDLLDE